MALFLVVALKEFGSDVDSAITAKVSPEERYKIESGKWIVSMEAATAKAVSDALELTETVTHLTLPIRGYFGRSQPDFMGAASGKKCKSKCLRNHPSRVHRLPRRIFRHRHPRCPRVTTVRPWSLLALSKTSLGNSQRPLNRSRSSRGFIRKS